MISQREYDIAQLEAELKMQAVFDEWRKAFLAERMIEQTISPQQPSPIAEEENVDIR